MHNDIYLWAQSTDNLSEDIFIKNREKVESGEEKRDFVSKVYQIAKTSKIEHIGDCVSIKRNGNSYLIELTATDLDVHGRLMPIVCMVENIEETNVFPVEDVMEEILFFINSIGRDIDERCLDICRSVMEGLSVKKSLYRIIKIAVYVFVAVLVSIVLINSFG